ncbi:TolC family outer membrane protein [Magnetospirillum sp. SS-4]|uniref:TolC family outer membrane protein n=1 Tax=Magnetospirillum sp. SS-4 TaxID=2681465 RepID=UPI0020C48FC9|nr:TolC family outer membrane protein [Magnetospirillum sp. SS-4]
MIAGIAVAVLASAVPNVGVAASLDEEMRDLVANHPQIQAKAKAVNSAEEAIRGARGDYLPSAKLSGDQGHEYIDSPDRRLTQGKAFFDKRHTSSLTVTQKLFDGFKTSAAVDAARTSHEISGSDLRSTRQTTLLEGAIAYLEILRQTKLVALSRENERKVTEQLNLEDERVQKGAGIASDVLAAKQRLQIAKERRVNYEGAFQAAVARYTQVFGHSPDVASLTDPPLPMDLIPETVEDSLDTAERENPSLFSATRTIDLTDDKRRVAEAGYWPTLDLVGKADYENGKNAVIGSRRDWSVLLVANWELFSGFKTDAAVAQASWDHAASKDNRAYTSRKISEAVRIAWHKLQTARQRLDLLENAAILAEEVWEAQRKKREAGKATVQEVLDEETKINEARIAYTGAYYDMYQAAYELLSGMGRLEVESLARATPASAPNLSPAGAADRMAPHTLSPTARLAPPPPQVPTPAPAPATVASPQAPNDAMMQQVRGLMAARDDFWNTSR